MVSPQSGPFVAAIDQGTTSTRCLLFDTTGTVVGAAQAEHTQYFPRPGWVEHDPEEIWQATVQVVRGALADAGLAPADLAACGIANQRETAVLWDRVTGRPVHPAVVWQDVRTSAMCEDLAAPSRAGTDRYRERTGLPLSTYFTGPKIAWVLDHVPGLRERAERGEILAGTVDSWLVWKLTGGTDGGRHVTDVTNASRTLLMDLRSLAWDTSIAADLRVPLAVLPEIRSSAEVYGHGATDGPLPGVPVAAALGDQHAALVGQACFAPGDTKATYGTGTFLLRNTGTEVVRSDHGLLSTVAYQLGEEAPVYALEGSVAVTGSLIRWMRDELELFGHVSEVEALAGSVEDNGGVYVVPAFSGLFAPRWRPDARGVVTGLTGYATKAHLVRAALEATGFQTREVVEATRADTGVDLAELRVDGGMVANGLLMQLQADILGVPVTRAAIAETTAFGACLAAGLAVGVWADVDELAACWRSGASWQPDAKSPLRTTSWRQWNRAVERSLDWIEPMDTARETPEDSP